MKRILLGDSRESLVSTLETILRHWGYRVLATTRADRFQDLLCQLPPDLVIVGTSLLAAGGEPLTEALCSPEQTSACPVVLLESEPPPPPPLSS